MKRADCRETAVILRRVLGTIERGELDAGSGFISRTEGAIATLEAIAARTHVRARRPSAPRPRRGP